MYSVEIRSNYDGYFVLLLIDGEWCDDRRCSTLEHVLEVAQEWLARN